MGQIIFDILLILVDAWIIFDEDTHKLSKCLALLAIILLSISVILHMLEMSGTI